MTEIESLCGIWVMIGRLRRCIRSGYTSHNLTYYTLPFSKRFPVCPNHDKIGAISVLQGNGAQGVAGFGFYRRQHIMSRMNRQGGRRWARLSVRYGIEWAARRLQFRVLYSRITITNSGIAEREKTWIPFPKHAPWLCSLYCAVSFPDMIRRWQMATCSAAT